MKLESLTHGPVDILFADDVGVLFVCRCHGVTRHMWTPEEIADRKVKHDCA